MKIEFIFDNITQLEELYYAVEHIPEGILEDEKEDGTPHDLIDVMFNLLDVNQLTQLEDIIVNQYGEN